MQISLVGMHKVALSSILEMKLGLRFAILRWRGRGETKKMRVKCTVSKKPALQPPLKSVTTSEKSSATGSNKSSDTSGTITAKSKDRTSNKKAATKASRLWNNLLSSELLTLTWLSFGKCLGRDTNSWGHPTAENRFLQFKLRATLIYSHKISSVYKRRNFRSRAWRGCWFVDVDLLSTGCSGLSCTADRLAISTFLRQLSKGAPDFWLKEAIRGWCCAIGGQGGATSLNLRALEPWAVTQTSSYQVVTYQINAVNSRHGYRCTEDCMFLVSPTEAQVVQSWCCYRWHRHGIEADMLSLF